MKIIAISDLHGIFPKLPEEHFDILCICGDIVPLKAQENMPQCKSWLKKKFIPWCKSLPCDKVLVVAGNHDFVFERTMFAEIQEIFKDSKVEYLENSSYEYNGVHFYGTPYCKEFGDWAFMRGYDNLKMIFENIPENIDILLTHDAPYGVSDICHQATPWNNFEHIGSPALREAILEKNPKINLHGHLHSTNHDAEFLGNTAVYNVSVLDESYDLAYPHLTLEV